MSIPFSRLFLQALFLLLLCTSCGTYKYAVLFKTDDEINTDAFKAKMKEAEANYVIKNFDQITVEVFTNKGERIPDPNGEFVRGIGTEGNLPQTQGNNQNTNPNMGMGVFFNTPTTGTGGGGGSTMSQFTVLRRFLIDDRGNTHLPIVGTAKLAGLKLYQADSLLSALYDSAYVDSYVVSQVVNRRVTVLGALGSRLVPLEQENMNLLEVIALAGNIDLRVRNDRIRLVRGVGTEKVELQLIDLSTWQGLQAANLAVKPGDVIYLEPRRGVGRRESIGDVTSILSVVGGLMGIITSTLTTIVLINRL